MKVCRICLCVCTIFSLFLSYTNLKSTGDIHVDYANSHDKFKDIPDICNLLNNLIGKYKNSRTSRPPKFYPQSPSEYKPSAFSENSECFRIFSCAVNILKIIKQDVESLKAALLYSSAAGFNSLIIILLKHGACPNIKNISGKTPLHLAVAGQHVETTAILLAAGAIPSFDTYTLALKLKNKNLSQLFTKYLCNLDDSDDIGAF